MLKIYFIFMYPLLRLGLSLLGLFVPKIRKGLAERRDPNIWFKTPRNQAPIIIHCSSGEFEYAKPLIREIKNKNPQQKIFISYFSPSYRYTIESTPGVDFSFPAPWD